VNSKQWLARATIVPVLGLLAWPGTVWSQGEVASAEVEEIIVTGSRIAKDEFTSAAPISVFDEQEYVNSGVVSVDEFLKDIPAFTGFQYGTTTNNGNIGLKAVDLRGLEVKRTLVLINGRRTVGSFIGGNSDVGAVDLNSIPNAMIKRIEVLKDGASTIYGSDALAGVVNVILKDDFEGFDIQMSYGAGTSEWDAENYGIAVTAGTSSDRGRMVFSAEYQQQEEMLQGDREWALYDLWPAFDPDTRTFVTSRSGSSNSRKIHTSTFDDASKQLLVDAGFGPPFYFIMDSGQAREFDFSQDIYNYSPVNALVTPNERHQISAIGSYDISDRITGFGELLYTRRSSHQRLAPDATFPGYLDYNGNPNDFVPASNPANPFGVNPNNAWGISGQDVRINRRFEESGGRIFEQSVDTYRIVAGMEGDFSDYASWEFSYTWAENEDFDNTQFYHRFDRWATMVDPALCGADANCVAATGGVGYLDPFCEFGCIDRDVFSYLMANSLKDIRKNDMEVIAVNFTGNFGDMQMGGGQPGWSFGYENRRESASYMPDEFTAGGLTTGGASDPVGGKFTVDEVYAEIYLPFSYQFTGEASVRYSDYDSVGDTTNFRVGVNWMPFEQLSFRGVYSTGFRAPNIVELYGGSKTDAPVVEDPCEFWNLRENASEYLGPNCQALGFDEDWEWGGQMQGTYFSSSSEDLEPEESENWTVGAVWEPDFAEGLSVSLDYWNIQVDGWIGTIPYNTLMWICANAADQDSNEACQFFENGRTHDDDYWPSNVNGPFGNLGKVTTDGLDLNFAYDRGVDWFGGTTFGFNIGATYLNKYEEEFPITGTSDRVGRIEAAYVYPEWKLNTAVSLSGESWAATWSTRYFSEMDDFYRPQPFLTDEPTAESIWYNDLYVNFFYDDMLSITLGVNNFTDEDPPMFHSAFNAETEPGYYDVVGRRFFMTATMHFE
jgi:iron complex outermembrane receptor protein